MEGGMVSARADGLDADVVTPAWREGWDMDYMRFIVHKWRDDLLGWSQESEATIKQAIKKGKAALRKRK